MTFGECGLLLTYAVMFYSQKDKKEEVSKFIFYMVQNCTDSDCRINFYEKTIYE